MRSTPSQLLRASGVAETPYARIAIERHRMVHSSVGKAFGADDLLKLMDSFSQLMQFTPALVIVDGLESASLNAGEWAAVAENKQIRLWLSARTPRHRPQSIRFGRGSITVVDLPQAAALNFTCINSVEPLLRSILFSTLDPVTMMLRPEESLIPIPLHRHLQPINAPVFWWCNGCKSILVKPLKNRCQS